MKTIQKVTCDLPGLENITVSYNLMATTRQIEAFRSSLDEETAKAVIVGIDGYVGNPYGDDAPFAFKLWLGYTGWQKALMQFVTDPNL